MDAWKPKRTAADVIKDVLQLLALLATGFCIMIALTL